MAAHGLRAPLISICEITDRMRPSLYEAQYDNKVPAVTATVQTDIQTTDVRVFLRTVSNLQSNVA